MPAVGQQLLDLRQLYLENFARIQTGVKEKVFSTAYESIVLREKNERYKKLLAAGLTLSDVEKSELVELKGYLEKEEVRSLEGALHHIFNITFATFGRDIVACEDINTLTPNQKNWLTQCYVNLKMDLLAMHKRMTLLALKNNAVELPQNEPGQSVEVVDQKIETKFAELRASENGLPKKIIESMELLSAEINVEIDKELRKILPPPVQQQPANVAQVAIVVEQPQPVNVVVAQPQQINVVVVDQQPVYDYDNSYNLYLYNSGYYQPYHYNRYYGGHHGGYHHSFSFHGGWHDAHRNYGHAGFYHHPGHGIDHQLLNCCNNVFAKDLYFKMKVLDPCGSCGRSACSCQSVQCPGCGSPQCICDRISDVGKSCCDKIDCNGFCNTIGNSVAWLFRNIGECCGKINCQGCCNSLVNGISGGIGKVAECCGKINCNCFSGICNICKDINCRGCSLPDVSGVCNICRGVDCKCKCDDCGDLGKGVGGGGAALGTGIAKLAGAGSGSGSDNSTAYSSSSTGMNYFSSSTGMAGPGGLSYHATQFSALDALSATGVASAASSSAHTTYLQSTASQVTGTLVYFGIAGPHIVRAGVTPTLNWCHSYKVRQSQREIVASVLSALTCFLACYFPAFGGPHTAAVFGGGGCIAGSELAKRYNHSANRLVFNGETNPEKWLLTSDILSAFSAQGIAPQDLVQVIFTLRDIKKEGASKTNNKGWGAYRVLRFLGYIVDQLKDQQELLPDEIMQLMRRKDPEAFGLMNQKFNLNFPVPSAQPFISQFNPPSAPPGPGSQIMADSNSSISILPAVYSSPIYGLGPVAQSMPSESEGQPAPLKRAPMQPRGPYYGQVPPPPPGSGEDERKQQPGVR